MLATKCTLGAAEASECVWGSWTQIKHDERTQNVRPPPSLPPGPPDSGQAQPKRVMSDVVSIADLMRRPMSKGDGGDVWKSEEFWGIVTGEAYTFGKTTNMHLLDNATNDDDDDKDK